MVYTIDELKNIIGDIAKQYGVKKVALFGSYSTGEETPDSDVDLLISTEITGIRFFGIAERLRKKLRKKIDLIEVRQLSNNQQLLDDILKDGIKVYEQI